MENEAQDYVGEEVRRVNPGVKSIGRRYGCICWHWDNEECGRQIFNGEKYGRQTFNGEEYGGYVFNGEEYGRQIFNGEEYGGNVFDNRAAGPNCPIPGSRLQAWLYK